MEPLDTGNRSGKARRHIVPPEYALSGWVAPATEYFCNSSWPLPLNFSHYRSVVFFFGSVLLWAGERCIFFSITWAATVASLPLDTLLAPSLFFLHSAFLCDDILTFVPRPLPGAQGHWDAG